MEYELELNREGVVVLSVDRGSPAARFGIRGKDIIVSINDLEIASTEMLDNLTRERVSGWRYVIERNGRLFEQYIR